MLGEKKSSLKDSIDESAINPSVIQFRNDNPIDDLANLKLDEQVK
jgi:hypothetical protein